jgi:hypothetical protein
MPIHGHTAKLKWRTTRRTLFVFAAVDTGAMLFGVITGDAMFAAFMGMCLGFMAGLILTGE